MQIECIKRVDGEQRESRVRAEREQKEKRESRQIAEREQRERTEKKQKKGRERVKREQREIRSHPPNNLPSDNGNDVSWAHDNYDNCDHG